MEISIDLGRVARDLRLAEASVQKTVELLDEGNTVPFITRYRKDQTGGLDEEQIRSVQDRVAQLRQLAERKQTVLKSLESQDSLTPELANRIRSAQTSKRLEDIYLPFRPKKQTLSTQARERGLEPLADQIAAGDPSVVDLNEAGTPLVDAEKSLASVDDVLTGVGHILAERISERIDVRSALRDILRRSGVLVVSRATPAKTVEPNAAAKDGDETASAEAAEPETEAAQAATTETETANPATEESAAANETTAPADGETATPTSEATEAAAAGESSTSQAEGQEGQPSDEAASAPADDVAQVEDANSASTDATTEAAAPSNEEAAAPQAETGEAAPSASASESSDAATPPEAAASDAPTAETTDSASDANTTDSAPEAGVAEPTPEDAAADASKSDEAAAAESTGASKEQPAKDAKKGQKGKAKETKSKSELKRQKKRQQLENAFKDYFDFREPLSKAPPHRILAINRGDRAKVLRVRVDAEQDQMIAKAIELAVPEDHPHAEFLRNCVRDAVSRLVVPALTREVRRELTEQAENHAVQVFVRNLRKLLLQPPVRDRRVLAIDPGFRNGCKIAVLDPFGQVLDAAVVLLVGKAQRTKAGRAKLVELVNKYDVHLIAIGNGAGCRETEQIVSDLLADVWKERDLAYVVVNEAGTSVYSTSPVGREELPTYDPMQRSAISIGRRLLDPLSELVKINPANIGVGLYQHDIKAKHLRNSLDAVVESCVNYVGVDVNTASPALLRSVSGLNQLTARRLYEYRLEHGPFANREQFKQVPGFGDATFVQAAGFLKIISGDNPFDATAIHPESYDSARMVLDRLGGSIEELSRCIDLEKPAAPTPPTETTPDDGASIVTAAAETAPTETALTETALTETAPTETASTETASTETASTETAPAETGAAENAPLETTPADTPVTEAASTEAASTEAASTEAASTETAPVETTPAETGAAENATPETTPNETPAADQAEAETEAASGPDSANAEASTTAEPASDEGQEVAPEPAAPPETAPEPAAEQPAAAADQAAPAEDPAPATMPAVMSTKSPERVANAAAAEITAKMRKRLQGADARALSDELQIGEMLLKDILTALAQPMRDPREDFPPPMFRRGVMKLEDLEPGIELEAVVLNVVDFGAFVDIGLTDSGLIHISRLADRYIKDPHEVVSVGDRLTVWVVDVDMKRRRVSLTAIRPGTEKPQRPRRPKKKQRTDESKPAGAPAKRERRPVKKKGVGRSHARYERKPPKPKRPAKPLTKEMEDGSEPMRSFSDLAQFFDKKTDDKKK